MINLLTVYYEIMKLNELLSCKRFLFLIFKKFMKAEKLGCMNNQIEANGS